MKVYYKWNIRNLKWYQRLYMRFTKTLVVEDGKHLIYTKQLGDMIYCDRVRK